MMLRFSLFLFVLFLSILLHAQEKNPDSAPEKWLTLEDIFHPKKKLDFHGHAPMDLVWMKDSKHYIKFDEEKIVWMKVHATTGEISPLYEKEKISKVWQEAHLPLASQIDKNFLWTKDHSAFLAYADEDLFYYNLSENKLIRLTQTKEAESEYDFSPDGKKVSFVLGYDLYVVEIASLKISRVTQDGNEKTLNGTLDWIYQEEIYGRGNFRGYWWSPDSNKIAFLRLDISKVPSFMILDDADSVQRQEKISYPKAGKPNPQAQLGIFDTEKKQTVWMDTSSYKEAKELLFVHVSWNLSGKRLLCQVQNRQQTWLDFLLVKSSSGKTKKLFRESTSAWVNISSTPIWLEEKSFLYLSEKDSFNHIYLYTPKRITQITKGQWEVRRLYGIEPKAKILYFLSTQASPVEEHIYRLPLSGTEPTRLSQQEGVHDATFSPDFCFYIDYRQNISEPIQVEIYDGDGRLRRTVYKNEPEGLKIHKLDAPKFLQILTRDHFAMEAMMIYPPHFDSTQKYPVLFHVYGGPQTPSVSKKWAKNSYLWHQMLAQRGYIVVLFDNRLASGKGAAPAWQSYKNIGKLEMQDIEDSVTWVKGLPYVDGDRLGIWGWSFGGYFVCYTMTHSKDFKIGIAVAPVTDWRNYDSIYTEKYMGLPSQNPEGYQQSSVITRAADLQGQLLLVHGLMDDNVHFQNTAQFVHALQKAGKQFDLMVYPKSRHSIELFRWHLFSKMTEFILKNL